MEREEIKNVAGFNQLECANPLFTWNRSVTIQNKNTFYKTITKNNYDNQQQKTTTQSQAPDLGQTNEECV